MRVLLSFLLCIFTFTVLQTEVQADFKKTKIAVLDFRQQGNDFGTDDMGKIVAEWLITAFVREGRFEVVERKLLGEVLEEQQMVETGIVDQETASEIGKLLGVKVIISGSVSKIQDVVEVNARIVDVASASIITADSVSSRDVTSLRQLVREMAGKIIKNFPLEGYVAHRNNDDIVIDLGRQSGVKPGMTFLVYKEGDVVKHPKTGEILYVTKIEIGIIEITTVQEKIAKGIILDEIEEDAIGYGYLIKSSTNGTLSRLPKKYTEKKDKRVEQTTEEFLDSDISNKSQTEETTNSYSAKALNSDGSALGTPTAARLFVETSPSHARVRVLNIGPRYDHGMILPAGSYHIEVSASGYQKVSYWYELKAGERKNILIELNVQPKKVDTVAYPALKKYYAMLWSDNSRDVQKAAKYLYKKQRKKNEVIDVAREVLANRYQERSNDRSFVDGMAFLCNILGVSGQKTHKSLLSRISKQAKSKKIRSYAAKNLKRL